MRFHLNLINRYSNCVFRIYFELNRNKKIRSKNILFNPYKNGLSSYDMAYLSSKRCLKNKTFNLQNDFQKNNLAA